MEAHWGLSKMDYVTAGSGVSEATNKLHGVTLPSQDRGTGLGERLWFPIRESGQEAITCDVMLTVRMVNRSVRVVAKTGAPVHLDELLRVAQ